MEFSLYRLQYWTECTNYAVKHRIFRSFSHLSFYCFNYFVLVYILSICLIVARFTEILKKCFSVSLNQLLAYLFWTIVVTMPDCDPFPGNQKNASASP